jgi:hypothetical protein
MAVASNEVQVKWNTGNDTYALGSGSEYTSDEMTYSATAFEATITLKADNSTTPADGDTVDFYLLNSAGDPDGSGSEEFPNDETDGQFLARLDTYTPGNDPAIATIHIPVSVKFKVFAKNNASTNSITISACVNEKTAA